MRRSSMLKHLFLCIFALTISTYLSAAEATVWKGELYAGNNNLQVQWAQLFFQKIPVKGHEQILDLGCGDGTNTRALFDRVPQGRVYGIDKSKSMIEAAQNNIPKDSDRLCFFVHDVTQSCFEPESFDIVVSTTALHWVEDQDAVVENTYYYLRLGGKLYFLIPTRMDLFFQYSNTFKAIKKLEKYKQYLKDAKQQIFVHKPDDYIDRLVRSGFRLDSLLVRSKENVFDSSESFRNWSRAWIFANFNTIPETMQEEFLTDFVDIYITQPGATDNNGLIHYYGYLMEVVATKS